MLLITEIPLGGGRGVGGRAEDEMEEMEGLTSSLVRPIL